MGFLFANAKKRTLPEVTGLQLQTAVNVVPIAICYGSPRVPINIIYANGFRSVKQKSGGASGGKGVFGGGGKGAATGVKYYATFIGALCEGEITDIPAMFENSNVYTIGTLPAGKQITAFLGGAGQLTPWSYISTKWPEDAFSYIYTAYVGFQDYELDSSGTIPQINFIISATYAATCPLNLYVAPDTSEWMFDADPALCVFDLLTNWRYGAGFPIAYIDEDTLWTDPSGFDPDVGDAALSTYCQAVGFGYSVILNNAEPASSILDRWLKNLVVAPVWTGEKLKFIPYCDSKFGLNPGYDEQHSGGIAKKYYTPNISPLFNLNDGDFIQSDSEEDPIVFARIDPIDAKNTVRTNFRDRYNYFNDVPEEAKDELAAELYGPRVERMGPADEFTFSGYAASSAQMQLQRNMSVWTTATFRLPPQWCFLEPMDIVTLTEATLDLVQFPVRIREIEEDEKGVLTLTVEEFRAASMQPLVYPRAQNTPPLIVPGVLKAPSINPPLIFEPTSELLAAQGQAAPTITLGVSAGPGGVFNASWAGADVYLSLDGISYENFGTVTDPSIMGITGNTLPAYTGANPDNTNTLMVNLLESEGDLFSVTDVQAAAGQNLIVVVDASGTYELISFTTATLTGPHQYTLSGLYRGMYGTQACEHDAAVQVGRVDGLMTSFTLDPAFIGRTIYARFLSFNIGGVGQQELSDADTYTYVPQGWGTAVNTNPLALALQSSVTPIDLGSFYTAATLDLGSIAGECAPGEFVVDLENY